MRGKHHMQIIRYPIRNPKLSTVAEFIWHFTSDAAESIDNKLLPVVNTDLIINLSNPIYYRFTGEKEVQASSVHIRYVKRRSQMIRQSGSINVWGVSLYPYGVYPFLRVDMNEQENQIIDLQLYNSHFVTSVLNGLSQIQNAPSGSHIIEDALDKWIGNSFDLNEIHMLRSFTQNMRSIKISSYCNQKGIGIKYLERLMKKYLGVTPKHLQQIGRFQTACNKLIQSSSITALTNLSYSYDYFDQSHFIKDFKEYTDETPSAFLADHNSIKENINHTQ